MGVAREAGETAESFGQRIADAIGKAKQSVMGKVHDMQDRASDAGGQVSAMAQQAGDTGRSRKSKGEGGRQQNHCTMGDNPLLLGAVALGFGALLGALIPQSEQEEAALVDAAPRSGRPHRTPRKASWTAVRDRGPSPDRRAEECKRAWSFR